MGKLVIHQEKIEDIAALISICPFGAMTASEGKVEIGAACRMCKLCVKKGGGAVEFVEDAPKLSVDKSKWQGIAVYIDHVDGRIHPVSFELLGKARELADKIHEQVYALFMGENIGSGAEELRHYGVDKVFVCDKPVLSQFNIEIYAKVFESFIRQVQPAAILVGATPVGRQLAPRVAARFRTGLARCWIFTRTAIWCRSVRPLAAISWQKSLPQIPVPRWPRCATRSWRRLSGPKRRRARLCLWQ